VYFLNAQCEPRLRDFFTKTVSVKQGLNHSVVGHYQLCINYGNVMVTFLKAGKT